MTPADNALTPKVKTQVQEADRGIYDRKNAFSYRRKTEQGLTEDIVRQISAEKGEPEWMLKKRLQALQIFERTPNPSWGPCLDEVDLDQITTYIRPNAELSDDWKTLPEEIYQTFDALGIPEAEKKSMLSGVGAQYDSEVVYHNIQQNLLDQGVVYTDFESGLKSHEALYRKYFAHCITPHMHRYAALHYAVWSGGSFVYVPKGVQVDVPLQSYFRLNAPGAGQFEHTLIIVEEGAYCHFIEGCSAPRYNQVNLHAGAVELFVGKGATLRYSTIENWSRNMYNLNTKRALVSAGGKIEWVSGSFGSKVSMLYPAAVLKGEGAHCEYTGISFAGHGQQIDTGAQVIHAAPHTSSSIHSKSISKDGGVAVYRGLIKVEKGAHHAKSSTACESLMLDAASRSDTIPVIDLQNKHVDLGHEAQIGRISEEAVFYLMSRGLPEQEARSMIVRGFAEPIAKELPMEYAVEMNNLINLELVGSIG